MEKSQVDVAAVVMRTGLFDAAWYVAQFADVARSGIEPAAHYMRFGILLGRPPCAALLERLATVTLDADRTAIATAYGLTSVCATQIETVPTDFDEAFYLQTNPHIDHRRWRPYDHFLNVGYKDSRKPNPAFDVVWYVQNYGHTFDAQHINPLVHYRQTGAALGYMPHPPRPIRLDPASGRPLPTNARRACLFAGYDPDGRIDDTVLRYVKELARHADVFYLADCPMSDQELGKLDGIVAGAWAQRHGAYDFGSYRLLAQNLVGWDRLSKYDEVLFVNDSCYLVRPLDETFARMDARSCAWWGMQATKGIAASRPYQPFPDAERLTLAEIREDLLDRFEDDPIYDFLIGSYFLAFRREVIADTRFRRVISAVRPERKKRTIVTKYEVGLTHFLIGCGYKFDTWAPDVTRKQPVYTDVAFDLLKQGFPLLKRLLMTENPYKVSSVAYWEALLPRLKSVTPIEEIRLNLQRVGRADWLYRNTQIMTEGVLPPPPMSAADFSTYDAQAPTYDHYWAFPVNSDDHRLSSRAQEVLDAVRHDPNLVKVVLTRGRSIPSAGRRVICLPIDTLKGQFYLARSRVVLSRSGARADLHWPLAIGDHNSMALDAIPDAIWGADGAALVARIRKREGGSRLLNNFSKQVAKVPRSVAFIYDPRQVASNRSRIFALLPGLRKRGWVCYTIDANHMPLDLLSRVQVVSLCGIALSDSICDVVESVRGSGGYVVCDTDSSVHDWPTFVGSALVQDTPTDANRLAQRSRDVAGLMEMADGISVATATLAEGLTSLGLPLCLLPSTLPATETALRPRVVHRGVHLCFMAGEALAQTDLAVCRAALCAVLADYPDVVMHMVGSSDTAPDWPTGQIRWYRPMSVQSRLDFLAGMDLNLMPLAVTDENATRPAVPVLEAACQAVPSLATNLEPLRAVIRDGVNGDLVRSPHDWTRQLRYLLTETGILRERGELARSQILSAFDSDDAAAILSSFFEVVTGYPTGIEACGDDV